MNEILRSQKSARWLVYLLYFLTFAPAALGKILGGSVPAWFVQQFEPTWLGLVPGLIAPSFWGIAALETLLSLSFFVLLVRPSAESRWARPVLLGALLLFVVLATGQHLAQQHDQALLLTLEAFATYFVFRTVGGDANADEIDR